MRRELSYKINYIGKFYYVSEDENHHKFIQDIYDFSSFPSNTDCL